MKSLAPSTPVPAILGFGLFFASFATLRAQQLEISEDFTAPVRGANETISLYDFAGSVVVLDFFAYWCGPCALSSPALETEINQHFADRGGNEHGVPVQVIGVNTEPYNPAATDQFIAEAGLDLVVDDPGSALFSRYGEGHLPHFIVIDGTTGGRFEQWSILYDNFGWGGWTARHLRDRINLVDGETTVETYSDWTRRHELSPGQNGPGDDPDGDGVPNLVAFGCGLDPKRAARSPAALGVCSREGAEVTYRFHRATGVGGFEEILQIKRGNGAWEDWDPPAEDITVTDEGDHEDVRIRLAFPDEKTVLLRRVFKLTQ